VLRSATFPPLGPALRSPLAPRKGGGVVRLWFLITGIADAAGIWDDARPLDAWFLFTGFAEAGGLWSDARAL